ncbi:MAG: hypothetical protein RLZZ618_3884 [Pseudomonadota bacterium]|jgi:hypothetical protein
MNVERVLSTTSAGPLLGGLAWRPVGTGRHSMRRLHAARHLVPDATHCALFESGQGAVYGFYQPRAAEENSRLPRELFSAAHCFARLVGQQAPNAALILSVLSDRNRAEDKVYVVVLDDGVPVVDLLTTDMEARNALGSEDRLIWSDHIAAYPNATEVDFEWLVKGADKSSRVLPIPINPWPLAMLGVAVALIALGWGVVQHRKKVEVERQRVAAAAASDPAPRYLAALNDQSQRMAADRSSMVAAVERMFETPVRVPGWSLKSVECSALSKRCASLWQRRGGSYDDLHAAVAGEQLELLSSDGSAVPVLDLARTAKPLTVKRHSLAAASAPLLPFREAIRQAGPLMQVWKTADLNLDIKGPQLWPRVESVPVGFTHPRALQSGLITVSDVPGPFIVEALQTAPTWISWETVQVDVGEGDIKGRLKFKAIGTYYALRD